MMQEGREGKREAETGSGGSWDKIEREDGKGTADKVRRRMNGAEGRVEKEEEEEEKED